MKEDNSQLDNFDIRLMQPEDAIGVVELYRSVYGNEYPVKAVYEVEGIMKQQENGDMIRIICRTGEGRVIGQTAIYRSCVSNPSLYEEGQGIVLPEYRNNGVLEHCMEYGHKNIYPHFTDGIWGEAVCNHVYMQKAGASLGCYESGIEIDLMPAASYQKEKSAQGRVSSLVMFKNFRTKSQTIYLPEVYDESLRYMYSVYNFGHSFVASNSQLPDTATHGQQEIFTGAGVARFTIMAAGNDLDSYLVKQEKEALAQNTSILQVYLSLSSPSVGAAVEVLRKHHYFLGAFLPRWFDNDGLLMQKTINEPNFDGIHLYSGRAEKILDIIKKDRESLL